MSLSLINEMEGEKAVNSGTNEEKAEGQAQDVGRSIENGEAEMMITGTKSEGEKENEIEK